MKIYAKVNIFFFFTEEWTVNTILWTASLPSGLTGADLSIFTAVFSYISDITSSSNRTARITILDVVYLTSMPIGVALGRFNTSTLSSICKSQKIFLRHILNFISGKYFFSFFNHSYTIMFGINASLMMISIIYSFFRLDWSTNSSQRPLKLCCLNASKKLFEEDEDEANRRKEPNCFLDFFNKNYLIESVQTIVKKRPNYGRIYIIALILSLGLYTFQRGDLSFFYS